MTAIILAAGVGKRLHGASGGKPKCLIRIGGRSLFNALASPRLRPLGYQRLMKQIVVKRLQKELRPFYNAQVKDSGGGLMVVGEKL